MLTLKNNQYKPAYNQDRIRIIKEVNLEVEGNSSLCLKAEVSLPLM